MALNASAEIAALDAFGPTIRVLQVANTFEGAPLADFSALAVPWSRAAARVMNATGFAGFSATCWFTGRELWRALGAGAVPVGLIEASVGGRSIRQFTPTAGLAACPQPWSDPRPCVHTITQPPSRALLTRAARPPPLTLPSAPPYTNIGTASTPTTTAGTGTRWSRR
jgi:hypothetical protein